MADAISTCLKDVPKVRKELIPSKEAKELSNRMKLLSHPTRLRILKLLCENDLCVCVLSEVIGRRQPNISQHLAKLKDNGIIENYQKGKFIFYRISDSNVKDMVRVICKKWSR